MWFFFSFCKMNLMDLKVPSFRGVMCQGKGGQWPHVVTTWLASSKWIPGFIFRTWLVKAVMWVLQYHFSVYIYIYIHISCFSTAAKNKSSQQKTVGLWFDPLLRFSVALQVFKVAARQEFKDLQRTKDSLIVWYFFSYSLPSISGHRKDGYLICLASANLILSWICARKICRPLGLWSPGRPGLCGLFRFCSFVGFILWPRRVCAFASGAHVWQHRRQGWGASAQFF